MSNTFAKPRQKGGAVPRKLLCIDVGNTSTQFALTSGQKIVWQFRLPTSAVPVKAVSFLKRKKLRNIEAVVIASVVPGTGRFLRRHLPQKLGLKTVLIGADLRVPIKNLYRKPSQVGTDRLVAALAASAERCPVIVVDFGTAITFDAVSSRGEYLGGVIAPGIEISLDALFERTALLPKIRLKHPASRIGRDTVESIRIGCSVGIAGLCDRIIAEIRRALGRKTKVVATGGYARFISRYCREIDAIRPNLVLQGISDTYLKSA